MQGKARHDALRWDDVRLFLALSRARTVGGAASSLGVDASTVSRRLVALEEAVAATLFDRARDGITATKAAEDLMPIAEAIEEHMMRFAQAAETLEREVSGLVRIACTPDLAAVLVLPIIGELRVRHPALRIQLDAELPVVDLTRREADLALRVVRPERGDLVGTRLRSARWMVVAAPKLARSLGTLRAWTDAPWIGWGERMSGLAPARWFAKHVRDIEPVVQTDNMLVQFAAAAAGLGLVLAPAPSAEHHGLVPLKLASALRPAAEEWPVNELFLVTHRALRDVPRVRVVWDMLVERIGERARRS